MRRLRLVLAALLALLLPAPPAFAIGFQLATVPDPEDQPLDIGIWYPSDSPIGVTPDALLHRPVARDGHLTGESLPLIVISHGSGGWLGGHADSAEALAEAGYVVAAPTHTADNYRDRSGYGTIRVLAGRPRQVKRTIDFMLGSWDGKTRIDASRIGIYGFSAGGYTALIAIGGVLDVTRIAVYCRQAAAEPECLNRPQRQGTLESPPPGIWTHDLRIKAAVIADPGLGFLFDKPALAGVGVPVQLWSANLDEVVSPRSTDIVRVSLPQPPDYHLVEGAGHYVYLPPCTDDVVYCKDRPGFDRAGFHRELNAAMIGFFGAALRTP
jgi:predicted dienelactone hydrolase